MTIQEQWTHLSKDPLIFNKALSYWKNLRYLNKLNEIDINQVWLIKRKDIPPPINITNVLQTEQDLLKRKALHSIWLKPLNWWNIWTRAWILDKTNKGYLIINVTKLPSALRFKTINDLRPSLNYNMKYIQVNHLEWCIEWVPLQSIESIKLIQLEEMGLFLINCDSAFGGMSEDALLGVLKNMSNPNLKKQIIAKFNCHLAQLN